MGRLRRQRGRLGEFSCCAACCPSLPCLLPLTVPFPVTDVLRFANHLVAWNSTLTLCTNRVLSLGCHYLMWSDTSIHCWPVSQLCCFGTGFSSQLACPCDSEGMFLSPEASPIPSPPKSGNAWSPFSSCAGFELMDLLFKKAELSQPHVDHLFSLWSTTLAPHGDVPPVADHHNLHIQIDSIKLGSVP